MCAPFLLVPRPSFHHLVPKLQLGNAFKLNALALNTKLGRRMIIALPSRAWQRVELSFFQPRQNLLLPILF